MTITSKSKTKIWWDFWNTVHANWRVGRENIDYNCTHAPNYMYMHNNTTKNIYSTMKSQTTNVHGEWNVKTSITLWLFLCGNLSEESRMLGDLIDEWSRRKDVPVCSGRKDSPKQSVVCCRSQKKDLYIYIYIYDVVFQLLWWWWWLLLLW